MRCKVLLSCVCWFGNVATHTAIALRPWKKSAADRKFRREGTLTLGREISSPQGHGVTVRRYNHEVRIQGAGLSALTSSEGLTFLLYCLQCLWSCDLPICSNSWEWRVASSTPEPRLLQACVVHLWSGFAAQFANHWKVCANCIGPVTCALDVFHLEYTQKRLINKPKPLYGTNLRVKIWGPGSEILGNHLICQSRRSSSLLYELGCWLHR